MPEKNTEIKTDLRKILMLNDRNAAVVRSLVMQKIRGLLQTSQKMHICGDSEE